jgi:hypothetical protein
MKRLFEASAMCSLSIIVTVVAVAAVLSVHPRAAAEATVTENGIVPAVATAGVEETPADAECPYLAAIAASSACPALPEAAKAQGCPFLDGQLDEAPERAHKPSGKHT